MDDRVLVIALKYETFLSLYNFQYEEPVRCSVHDNDVRTWYQLIAHKQLCGPLTVIYRGSAKTVLRDCQRSEVISAYVSGSIPVHTAACIAATVGGSLEDRNIGTGDT